MLDHPPEATLPNPTQIQISPKSLFSNYHVNQKLQRDLCHMLQHTIETSIEDLQRIPVNNLRQQTLKPQKRFIVTKDK